MINVDLRDNHTVGEAREKIAESKKELERIINDWETHNGAELFVPPAMLVISALLLYAGGTSLYISLLPLPIALALFGLAIRMVRRRNRLVKEARETLKKALVLLAMTDALPRDEPWNSSLRSLMRLNTPGRYH